MRSASWSSSSSRSCGSPGNRSPNSAMNCSKLGSSGSPAARCSSICVERVEALAAGARAPRGRLAAMAPADLVEVGLDDLLAKALHQGSSKLLARLGRGELVVRQRRASGRRGPRAGATARLGVRRPPRPSPPGAADRRTRVRRPRAGRGRRARRRRCRSARSAISSYAPPRSNCSARLPAALADPLQQLLHAFHVLAVAIREALLEQSPERGGDVAVVEQVVVDLRQDRRRRRGRSRSGSRPSASS